MADWRDIWPKLSDLEEAYFQYLVDLVGADRGYGDTYVTLCRCLHEHPYIWKEAKDKSRAVDGEYLRYDFCEEMGVTGVREDLPFGCTVLEMLIGKAKRRDFIEYDSGKFLEIGDRIAEIFWDFIEKSGEIWATDHAFSEKSGELWAKSGKIF